MKKIFIFIIKCYHKYISPWLPGACRFYPTCSMYTVQAIEKFGVIRGLMLGIWRILRCNPFCHGGYDPIPEKFTFKRQNINTCVDNLGNNTDILNDESDTSLTDIGLEEIAHSNKDVSIDISDNDGNTDNSGEK